MDSWLYQLLERKDRGATLDGCKMQYVSVCVYIQMHACEYALCGSERLTLPAPLSVLLFEPQSLSEPGIELGFLYCKSKDPVSASPALRLQASIYVSGFLWS